MIHVVKRKAMPVAQQLAIRIGIIVLALVVCGLITTLATGLNPIDVYATMIHGAFGTQRKVWILLQETAILLCVSLALTPAFRMKFWNLGGEGQIMAGALASAACMILVGDTVPNWALILLMFATSLVAGAVWAVIPAVFSLSVDVYTPVMTMDAPGTAAGIINQSTNAGWFPQIAGQKYLLNVILVLIVTVAMYVYLNYTKHGYEISVVGESTNTARYVGIKVNRVIIRTLFISGAICGFTGLLLVGGTNHTLTTTISGGRGFTAVMVAWLAKFDPLIMVASSLLLEFMRVGANEISTIYGLNQSFGDILTGVILFFIIGTEFFITYRVVFSKREGTTDV